MSDATDEHYKLLEFQTRVHKCVTKLIPYGKMLGVFMSFRGDGALSCLISHIFWIFKLIDENHAFELAQAFVETGVSHNSNELILQSVHMYLRRPDSDLRLVPHFERQADFLRTFAGQFAIRHTILYTHNVHLESLCSECEKLIEFLAEQNDKKFISLAQLTKLKNSPGAEKAEKSLSKSGNTPGRRKAQKGEVRDGNQSE